MPETSRDEIARRIGAYAAHVRPYFKTAFAAASEASETARAAILEKLIETLKGGRRGISGTDLAQIGPFTADVADQLATVYSLMIGMFSESTATADDFVDAAKDILFEPVNEPVVRSIALAICNRRAEIDLTVSVAQLAGVVLPSLRSISVAVDVRVKVDDGAVTLAVPVVVMQISTDVDERDLFLQLSKGDVEQVILKLQGILKDIEIAQAAFSVLQK